MASFKSVLSAIGHVLAKAFSPSAIRVEATIAEIALPGFAGLIQAVAGAVINAESVTIAAGQQSGTGAQKAALVISEIEAIYNNFAAANSIPVIPENKQKFVDAIVAALNSFPAPASAA